MKPTQKASLQTLANATELATQVILRVAGGAVSSNLDGVPITASALSPSVAAKIQTGISHKLEN